MEISTAQLAKHPFFAGLSEPQLETLLQDAMWVQLRPDEFVFHEGEPANRFYLIVDGMVAIKSRNQQYGAEEAPILVDTVGGGEVLGWSWMFSPYLWHFDALTLTPVKAIFFYGTRLRERCDQDQELGYTLMKRAAEVAIHRLQATRKRLMEINCLNSSA